MSALGAEAGGAGAAGSGRRGEGAADLARVVGGRVRVRRRRRGLSQAGLAALIGHERSTVCRWEAGARLPSLPSLLALAAALGCAPAELLPEGEPVAGDRSPRARPRSGPGPGRGARGAEGG